MFVTRITLVVRLCRTKSRMSNIICTIRANVEREEGVVNRKTAPSMMLLTLNDTRGDSVVIVLTRRKSSHKAKKKTYIAPAKQNTGGSRGSSHKLDEYYPDSQVEINPRLMHL